MSDERVDKLTAQVAGLNDKIKALSVKKDATAAKYRTELLALNADRDAVAAELAAARKVAGLTEGERQALAAELAAGGN